jgi:cytochrome c5
MDCHDPHEAKSGTHVQGTAFAGPPLQGAWGAQLSSNPAFWTAPASGNFTKKAIVAGTDLEATLCFKCHTGYYWGTGTPPTSPSGAFAETDQAREFNPANVGNYATVGTTSWQANETAGSFHPVLASAAGNLGATDNIIAPWTRNSLMTCSDCHESDSTTDPSGPHGSAARFILKGPNTVWNNTVTATSTGMPANTFCINCHNQNFTGSRFNPGQLSDGHVKSNHRVACFNCHTAIPHGGPRPGLLVAIKGVGTNVPAVITEWDRSAPYYQGTAAADGTKNGMYLVSYPATNGTLWAKSNCACNSSGSH